MQSAEKWEFGEEPCHNLHQKQTTLKKGNSPAEDDEDFENWEQGESEDAIASLCRCYDQKLLHLLHSLISFVYGLVIGGVNRKSDIEMMEYEAQEADKLGRIRVIVQDNSPIHRCQEVQQLWSKWESQNLYIFFLPKYCSEMNPIELEWQYHR